MRFFSRLITAVVIFMSITQGAAAYTKGPWDPATLTLEQTVLVAEKVMGEVGPLGEYDFMMMVCTVANRLNSAYYPDSVRDVLRAYFARPVRASEEFIWITEELLSGRMKCPVEGMIYGMSKQDITSHNWVESTVQGARVASLQISYFSTWPKTLTVNDGPGPLVFRRETDEK